MVSRTLSRADVSSNCLSVSTSSNSPPRSLGYRSVGHGIVAADDGEHLLIAVPMFTPGSPVIAV